MLEILEMLEIDICLLFIFNFLAAILATGYLLSTIYYLLSGEKVFPG